MENSKKYGYKMCIEEIDWQIIVAYNMQPFHYNDKDCLLEIRQSILNKIALSQQEKIIKTIKEFNDSLRTALKEMYDQAHLIYNDIVKHHEYADEMEVIAKCYLCSDSPSLHPLQGDAARNYGRHCVITLANRYMPMECHIFYVYPMPSMSLWTHSPV